MTDEVPTPKENVKYEIPKPDSAPPLPEKTKEQLEAEAEEKAKEATKKYFDQLIFGTNTMLDKAMDSEIIGKTAKLYKAYYDKLIQEGFTADQAITLTKDFRLK